jgi:RNA polymerase sigma-70 factor (ECF subfamily)
LTLFDGRIEALWREAVAQRPPGWLTRERFADHLRALAAGDQAAAPLQAADLYLARACADGHPEALAAFEREVMPGVRAALLGRGTSAAELEEAMQAVRERLLVARGGEPPRIADYAGRGPLRRWVRAAAIHVHLNQLRGRRREVLATDERLLDVVADNGAAADVEYMKQLYRDELVAAFGEAMAALPDRQRLLLRYRFVDALSVERVAAILRVHRATAHRWLQSAQGELAAATVAALRRRVEVSESQLDEIRRLVQSRIELTLSRVLGKP